MTIKPVSTRPAGAIKGCALPLWEFVAMCAGLIALNALAIDIMLPALSEIAGHYRLIHDNDQQLTIFAYIAGFGLPQLIFGPIADRFGRKGPLRICLLGYMLTGFASILAPNFGLLLFFRFVQGIFASGVRVITVSIVRDLMAGRAMARVMSLVMTVFMLIPIVAPALGAGVMVIASWQWIFAVLGFGGFAMLIWTNRRLPETLAKADRQALNFPQVIAAYRKILTNRAACGYMVASGVIFGALFAFIGASEQIFSDTFALKDSFPIWFAGIAVCLAIANLVNARIVEWIGMRRISHAVLIVFTLSALISLTLIVMVGEQFWIFYPLFCVTFACFGLLGANFSALAMEDLGAIAGTGSAVYGFATSTVSSLLGYLVAGQYDGTLAPFMAGFVALGILAIAVTLITEKGKLFQAR